MELDDCKPICACCWRIGLESFYEAGLTDMGVFCCWLTSAALGSSNLNDMAVGCSTMPILDVHCIYFVLNNGLPIGALGARELIFALSAFVLLQVN